MCLYKKKNLLVVTPRRGHTIFNKAQGAIQAIKTLEPETDLED